jgi:microcystin-dependent protein
MSEPYLAEIHIVAFNFAPRGYALCDGQILPINQNQALYALLGTTYGGDGRTTFALPDLRGRIPFHVGPNSRLGQKSGEETHTLSINEMPNHQHTLYGHAGPSRGDTDLPGGSLLAESPMGDLQYATASPNASMDPACIAPTGSSQGHENLPPVQVLNFVIALQGLFPPRN